MGVRLRQRLSEGGPDILVTDRMLALAVLVADRAAFDVAVASCAAHGGNDTPSGSEPKEAAMPRSIGRQEVQDLVAGGAQLVDVLAAEEFEEEHLPGAISIPLRRIDREAPDKLAKDRPIIVYCWDS